MLLLSAPAVGDESDDGKFTSSSLLYYKLWVKLR